MTKKRKCEANKPVPFLRNTPQERKRCVYLSLCFLSLSTLYTVILSWFVDVEVANSAIADNKIIEENDIEVRPEKISVLCLDKNVCLESCRKYCSQVTWSALMNVVGHPLGKPHLVLLKMH